MFLPSEAQGAPVTLANTCSIRSAWDSQVTGTRLKHLGHSESWSAETVLWLLSWASLGPPKSPFKSLSSFGIRSLGDTCLMN